MTSGLSSIYQFTGKIKRLGLFVFFGWDYERYGNKPANSMQGKRQSPFLPGGEPTQQETETQTNQNLSPT
jgi:hypothetical protein